MDLAALWDMWSENGTNGCHFIVFSVCLPLYGYPPAKTGELVVLAMPENIIQMLHNSATPVTMHSIDGL